MAQPQRPGKGGEAKAREKALKKKAPREIPRKNLSGQQLGDEGGQISVMAGGEKV